MNICTVMEKFHILFSAFNYLLISLSWFVHVGVEFLKPIQGFFCSLCHQFSGDGEDAEIHMLSEKHNSKFVVKSPKFLHFFVVL